MKNWFKEKYNEKYISGKRQHEYGNSGDTKRHAPEKRRKSHFVFKSF